MHYCSQSAGIWLFPTSSSKMSHILSDGHRIQMKLLAIKCMLSLTSYAKLVIWPKQRNLVTYSLVLVMRCMELNHFSHRVNLPSDCPWIRLDDTIMASLTSYYLWWGPVAVIHGITHKLYWCYEVIVHGTLNIPVILLAHCCLRLQINHQKYWDAIHINLIILLDIMLRHKLSNKKINYIGYTYFFVNLFFKSTFWIHVNLFANTQ